jgi:hypothetical protein
LYLNNPIPNRNNRKHENADKQRQNIETPMSDPLCYTSFSMTETVMRIQSSHTLKESSLELQYLSTCKIETQLDIKVIAILNPTTYQQTGKRGDPKQKVYL